MNLQIVPDTPRKKHYRETYHWYASHGICTNCHSDEIYSKRSSSLCLTCLMDKREKKKPYYHEKMTTEQKYKLYLHNKKREEILKAFGVCVACQKRDVVSGHVKCGICLAKSKAANEKIRRKKGISPIWFKSPTVCGRCKKEKADDGCGLCPRCYADAMKALEKAHSIQNNDKHIWRAYDMEVFGR